MRLPLAALALSFLSGPAGAERLVVSLSANQVVIGSNFTGARLALHAVIERDGQSAGRPGPYDVVVTVRGPREPVTVRRKGAVGPVWINRDQQKFVAVPTVLSVQTSRPAAEIASPPIRRRLRIGIDEIVDGPELTLERTGGDDPFRAALIRLKTRDGTWSEDPRGIVFVTPSFVRANVVLPATAPTGNYDVEVLLLSDDTLLSRRNASFEVVKTGFEEGITSAAQEHPFAYGLGIAGLALLFGWIASIIFRRD